MHLKKKKDRNRKMKKRMDTKNAAEYSKHIKEIVQNKDNAQLDHDKRKRQQNRRKSSGNSGEGDGRVSKAAANASKG